MYLIAMISTAIMTPQHVTTTTQTSVTDTRLEELLVAFEDKVGFPFHRLKDYTYDADDQSLDITHKSGEEYYFSDEEADEILDTIYEIEDIKRATETDW